MSFPSSKSCNWFHLIQSTSHSHDSDLNIHSARPCFSLDTFPLHCSLLSIFPSSLLAVLTYLERTRCCSSSECLHPLFPPPEITLLSHSHNHSCTDFSSFCKYYLNGVFPDQPDIKSNPNPPPLALFFPIEHTVFYLSLVLYFLTRM